MPKFTTKLIALDPFDGQLKEWRGHHVEADSWESAQEFCNAHMGYLIVDGILVEEIETDIEATRLS